MADVFRWFRENDFAALLKAGDFNTRHVINAWFIKHDPCCGCDTFSCAPLGSHLLNKLFRILASFFPIMPYMAVFLEGMSSILKELVLIWQLCFCVYVKAKDNMKDNWLNSSCPFTPCPHQMLTHSIQWDMNSTYHALKKQSSLPNNLLPFSIWLSSWTCQNKGLN